MTAGGGKPARRLRQPDEKRADKCRTNGAEAEHPTPRFKSERLQRREPAGEENHGRCAEKSDRGGHKDQRATALRRQHIGEIGRHQDRVGAHRDPRQHPIERQPFDAGAGGREKRRHGQHEKRDRNRQPPASAVGKPAQQRCTGRAADKDRGQQERKLGWRDLMRRGREDRRQRVAQPRFGDVEQQSECRQQKNRPVERGERQGVHPCGGAGCIANNVAFFQQRHSALQTVWRRRVAGRAVVRNAASAKSRSSANWYFWAFAPFRYHSNGRDRSMLG